MTDQAPGSGLEDKQEQPGKRWPVIGAVVLVVAVLLWLGADHLGLKPFSSLGRTMTAFLVALGVLVGSGYTIFEHSSKPTKVEYVIAFDITVFVVIGLALVISASTRWQAACLTAGAALLGGGFFGFIFGMPLSAANTPDPGVTGAKAVKAAEELKDAFASGDANQIEAAKQQQTQVLKAAGRIAKHSLLAEAGSTLSKLIAGATLVQIKPIFDEFKRASEFISVYLLQDAPANGATLGGAVLLYFIFLGFLSGLFLPAYFMQDFWDR